MRPCRLFPTPLSVVGFAVLFNACTSCLAAQQGATEAQAEAAYGAHHYADSAALYRQVLADLPVSPDRGELEYDLACSEALAGQHDLALTDLAAAVRDGYIDAADIGSDTDLLSLHGDPKFTAAIAVAQAASAEQDRRWGTAAFKTAYSPTLSDADKVAGLSLVWAQARFGFGNAWHVPALDWDALYRATIPQALAAPTTYAYYRVLQHFIAQLHDGHSDVYMPPEVELRNLPLSVALVEGRVLITALFGSPADRPGLAVGDEIVSVNGEPVQAWAAREVAPYQSASSPQDLAARTYSHFVAPAGTAFALGIRPVGTQTQRTLTLLVGAYRGTAEPFAFRLLPGGIAYVALNEFGDDADQAAWDAHWPQLAAARAIILDLRHNGGGSDAIGSHVLATLIGGPIQESLSRSTRWIATYRAWGRAETPMTFPVPVLRPDPKRHFGGPVVMLAGSRTYSAAEDMVVAFRQARRGTIVGEPTGGSTGQPLSFDLPGGGSARICTKHDSFADGTEFVGVGVQPDILVAATAADVQSGRDAVLERATALLQRQ